MCVCVSTTLMSNIKTHELNLHLKWISYPLHWSSFAVVMLCNKPLLNFSGVPWRTLNSSSRVWRSLLGLAASCGLGSVMHQDQRLPGVQCRSTRRHSMDRQMQRSNESLQVELWSVALPYWSQHIWPGPLPLRWGVYSSPREVPRPVSEGRHMNKRECLPIFLLRNSVRNLGHVHSYYLPLHGTLVLFSVLVFLVTLDLEIIPLIFVRIYSYLQFSFLTVLFCISDCPFWHHFPSLCTIVLEASLVKICLQYIPSDCFWNFLYFAFF